MNKIFLKLKVLIKKSLFKYLVISISFLIWMTFLDTNSLLIHAELNREIKKLKKKRDALNKEILDDKSLIEKLNNIDDPGYKYHGQYNYLTSLLEELNLGNSINLVIHDWGSAMGFQFARENSERIKSITFMEAIVMPMVWDQWPEMARKIFGLYRSEAGEELILEKNYFVEKILFLDAPNLTEDDKNEYRRPFVNSGEDRRPTLTWPRQIPLEGAPPEVLDEVQKNADFHKDSDIPKIFINAVEGFTALCG